MPKPCRCSRLITRSLEAYHLIDSYPQEGTSRKEGGKLFEIADKVHAWHSEAGTGWKACAHDYVLPAATHDTSMFGWCGGLGCLPLHHAVCVVRDATADYPLQALIDALG
jgi:hypothetical protein